MEALDMMDSACSSFQMQSALPSLRYLSASFKEGKNAKPGPGSQIGAVGRCEVEAKATHSFNICPKAPHGSQMQCCNMRRRIGKHQTILEEQT